MVIAFTCLHIASIHIVETLTGSTFPTKDHDAQSSEPNALASPDTKPIEGTRTQRNQRETIDGPVKRKEQSVG